MPADNRDKPCGINMTDIANLNLTYRLIYKMSKNLQNSILHVSILLNPTVSQDILHAQSARANRPSQQAYLPYK